MSDDQPPPSRSERILADLRAGMTTRAIVERHGVSHQAVNQYRRRHGIPHPPSPRPPSNLDRQKLQGPHPKYWRDDEVQYLIAHQDDDLNDVARALGRPVALVRAKRFKLIRSGEIAPRGSRWSVPGSGRSSPFTEADLALITDLSLTAREVGKRIGRSPEVVRQYRRRHGLVDGERSKRWTPEEDALLLSEPRRRSQELADLLGRSVSAIDQRRSILRQRRAARDEDERSG